MLALLPLALICELLTLITRLPLLSVVSGALLVLFFAWHWRSLMPYPRRLGLVTLSLFGYWMLFSESDWQQTQRMLSAAAYYGAFIGALSLAHCAVKRLPQLGELHRLLLRLPRASLYPSYLFSTFAISSVLSFGMLNLVCGSLERYLDRQPYNPKQRREGARGVMVTALRGFALVPLLAPTSVAVAILTRELPGLSWSALLPFGLFCGAILLAVGWPMENRRLQQLQQTAEPVQAAEPADTANGLRSVLYGSLLGILAIALLASLTWLSATQAAMLLVPLAVIGLLLYQGGSPVAVYTEVRDTLAGMRNETLIFACSALLGGLTAVLIPVERLASHFSNTPLALFGLGSAGMLTIIILALLGVAPIISLSLCAALLAQLAGHGVAIMQPAVALLVGFSLAMLLSPYGPSALMLARHAELSPWRIAFGWNGRFVLLVLGPLLLVPLLA
ncbi:hypothetical protein NAU58_10855 [Pseudomonas stutzeri]|uniref:Uncharacterized protein n=1 Tax=Stutzerimonas stutzeri TaxID=316 RepID=A0A2N8RY66_STUST|nr:hypothetical protein [Stutzerimonas stutzeri]MCQ4296079.1 hypothetical protein [Stutzerimonas stutzeri]PNF79328.1 hypothetical protein CXK92_17605 [Stutzerimonas stutzeri]